MDKCTSAALQLIRDRGEGEGEEEEEEEEGGGGRTEDSHRLQKKVVDVGSLRECMRQGAMVPCRVPETQLLEQRLQEVESFQQQAQQELDLVASSAHQLQTRPLGPLEALLERGERLGVGVPELDQLRVVRHSVVHLQYMYMYVIHLQYTVYMYMYSTCSFCT